MAIGIERENPSDIISKLSTRSNHAGMIKEFKQVAMRGSVLDMAIGIVIGGAFGKIVSPLVSDVLEKG